MSALSKPVSYRLARTGYFKPIRKEDIRVQLDDANTPPTSPSTSRRIGQQRASLAGGTGQFGSTIGVVYTVFDLLNREELLSPDLTAARRAFRSLLAWQRKESSAREPR